MEKLVCFLIMINLPLGSLEDFHGEKISCDQYFEYYIRIYILFYFRINDISLAYSECSHIWLYLFLIAK